MTGTFDTHELRSTSLVSGRLMSNVVRTWRSTSKSRGALPTASEAGVPVTCSVTGLKPVTSESGSVVNVSTVESPPAGFGSKLACTPFGSGPESAKLTSPDDPAVCAIAIGTLSVSPCRMTRKVFCGVSVKSGGGGEVGRSQLTSSMARASLFCELSSENPRIVGVGTSIDSSVWKPSPALRCTVCGVPTMVPLASYAVSVGSSHALGSAVQSAGSPRRPTRIDTRVCGAWKVPVVPVLKNSAVKHPGSLLQMLTSPTCVPEFA